MNLSRSARSLIAVVLSFIATYFILFAVIGALMAQDVQVEDNEVVIRIKIQVDGAVSGTDTVYVTHPPDTVYVIMPDTVYVPQIEYITLTDTVYVIHPADTVTITEYIDRTDTLYVTEYDTTYITETITEIEYVDRIDTVYTTVYDTLYYPQYHGTQVHFGEPKNREWLDHIVMRPIGWATGTVDLTGSQYPWWGDIEFNISSGDIWGLGDYFMYANIPVKDWTYTEARLDSFAQADHRARTGIHLRESYDPGAKFVQLAYQSGRACLGYRISGEVETGGCVDAVPPIVFEASYLDGLFIGRVKQATGPLYEDTTLVHEWEMPFEFGGWFYSGLAVTSWRPDLVSKANYLWLDITDNHPWFGECRDKSNNIIDCD